MKIIVCERVKPAEYPTNGYKIVEEFSQLISMFPPEAAEGKLNYGYWSFGNPNDRCWVLLNAGTKVQVLVFSAVVG